ncbi:hypothetical protein BU14_0165s0004 [Porphyra umbilicalis]|uniref:Uncharacterized protein n=1 Tax=Porphyra umbilicalis TaxID=2786 RepID=A0A1X6P8B7_PORUM|nr:hypothetical protein BU14_0165s0004 [Porphyra umbilicalis]|eukprot:OSX77010.1 hypothetical protein BU14_0165s0004 [Porphyra umbilicalis]
MRAMQCRPSALLSFFFAKHSKPSVEVSATPHGELSHTWVASQTCTHQPMIGESLPHPKRQSLATLPNAHQRWGTNHSNKCSSSNVLMPITPRGRITPGQSRCRTNGAAMPPCVPAIFASPRCHSHTQPPATIWQPAAARTPCLRPADAESYRKPPQQHNR